MFLVGLLLGASVSQARSGNASPSYTGRAHTTVSPSTLNSSITFLFQNNLNYTDDANHVGALLLDPLPSTSAQYACAALGETLIPFTTIQGHLTDFALQFAYHVYAGTYSVTQSFWTADGTIGIKGTRNSTASKNTAFPVLCTQSSHGSTFATSLVTANNTVAVISGTNTFIGYRNLKSFRFLGIPYANPTPRWTYSTVNSAKNTVFPATAYGPQCFQAGSGVQSEQCFYLNIWTPYLPSSKRKSAAKLKPVFIMIHGGAYVSGTGADLLVDGGNVVSRGDVVVVTINYRLQTFGFLAVPGTNITGNYGIADQITALDWVRANIASFGGDPENITIGGQSAGAGSVIALLGSPKAAGKFAAALPASNLGGYNFAATYGVYYTPAEEATVAANNIIQLTNCTSTSLAAQAACLGAVAPSTLAGLSTIAAYIIVDGTYIVEKHLNVTSPGKAAHVPLLIGIMAEDGAPFISYPTGIAATNLTAAINSATSGAVSPQAVISSGLFPVPNTGNVTLDIYNVTGRIATDVQLRCVDQALIYSAVKHGVFPSVHYYQFDRSYQPSSYNPNPPTCQPPITPSHPNGDTSLPYLRCHGGELYFQWSNLDQFGLPYRDAGDVSITQVVIDYWTSFIRTHDPNPSYAYLAARGYTHTLAERLKTGTWEPVTNAQLNMRIMDVPSRGATFPEIDQCKLVGLPITYYESE